MYELSLYYREGCHLCHQMLIELTPYLNREDVHLRRIDIDEDAELSSRYNDLVPVLHVNDEPVCKYKLNHARLLTMLSPDQDAHD